MTLCDSSYPRKLAFHYLQDLQKEFERLDNSLVEKITRPYSFVKFGNLCNPTLLVWCYICMENWWLVFLVCTEIACYYAGISLFLLSNLYSNWLADGVIGSIRKQYIDTRTQANLSKLNANRKKDLEIITEHISEILQRKRNSGKLFLFYVTLIINHVYKKNLMYSALQLSEISERLPATTPRTASPVWGSPLLEVCSFNEETM